MGTGGWVGRSFGLRVNGVGVEAWCVWAWGLALRVQGVGVVV